MAYSAERPPVDGVRAVNIHILGICGTFMGGLALLARAAGHRVSGSDQGVYPPMSTQLEQQGITLAKGYRPEHIESDIDLVIIGNALSRGNPAVEHILNHGVAYASGAQWLGEHFLRSKHVLAVAGTHGKTTTSSMLAWILQQAGLEPGFLIGGVPENFGVSARPGGGKYFVIEADEYDTAFFDKRSKFVHYHPDTLILNNLEFDHADIFPDLDAIKTQFHHLVRTVPGRGRIIWNQSEPNLSDVLATGCWTQRTPFGTEDAPWSGTFVSEDQRQFEITDGEQVARGNWSLSGLHNLNNAVAACAAAADIGVSLAQAVAAFGNFKNTKRRLELVAEVNDVTVIDDFAHHPTAIATTLAGLNKQYPGRRLLVAFEPRSNSMKLGAHADALAPALRGADWVYLLKPADLPWNPAEKLRAIGERLQVADDAATLIGMLKSATQPGDVIVFMSNGGFDNAPRRFVETLGNDPD